MNWDDLRFFLAVARKGSIRAAAASLKVTHATVARRIAGLEAHLGVRLFEKLPSGYVVTSASEEILALAEQMEEQVNAIGRQLYGRDAGLTGKLRITLPTVLATDLLMPNLVHFAQTNPGIELEMITSYETLNLTKRQADVAIRLVYENETPPEHLYGRKLSSVYQAVYTSASKPNSNNGETETNWIIKEEDAALPAPVKNINSSTNEINYIVNNLAVQAIATREGLGASLLPCFVGDPDPRLTRVSPSNIHLLGDLWILTHGDLRHTPRVRAFTTFIAEEIIAKKDLLEGRGYIPRRS